MILRTSLLLFTLLAPHQLMAANKYKILSVREVGFSLVTEVLFTFGDTEVKKTIYHSVTDTKNEVKDKIKKVMKVEKNLLAVIEAERLEANNNKKTFVLDVGVDVPEGQE